MALAANFRVQFGYCRAGNKSIPARAGHFGIHMELGMDSGFHKSDPDIRIHPDLLIPADVGICSYPLIRILSADPDRVKFQMFHKIIQPLAKKVNR